jgi:hypothetical protein
LKLLGLKLVGWRSGAELESRRGERELVNAVGEIAGGTIDASIGGSYRIHVDAAVVDVDQAEAKVVDQLGGEKVSLGDAEETIVDGEVIGKVEIGGSGWSAQRGLQSAGAEGDVLFGVGKEEASRDFVFGVVKIAVPVGSELIIDKFAGAADGERNQAAGQGSCRDVAGKREKKSVGGCAELIAGEGQQRGCHGVDAGQAQIRGQGGLGSGGCATVRGGHVRHEGADESSRRIAATLAGALIVHEEKSELAVGHDRSAQASAEDILLDDGTRRSSLVEKIFVGIENGVAEKLVGVSVEGIGAGFQNGVNVAAAIATLAGVVERGLDFEFLDDWPLTWMWTLPRPNCEAAFRSLCAPVDNVSNC